VKTVKGANCDACFLIADVDIAAYASVVVAAIPIAANVAVAPSIHVAAEDAPAFTSVDDVAVSYRN